MDNKEPLSLQQARHADDMKRIEHVIGALQRDNETITAFINQRNELQRILEKALTTDGAHHKQYFLWKIVDILGVRQFMDIEADEGIVP